MKGGLWRQRNFALFWTGESVSEFGNSITVIVVPLIAITTLHTSTFIVTLLTAMTWFPWLIIGVPAGAWVDRLPPRAVMMTCDAISLLAYASVPIAVWLGVATVAQLIAVTLIAGTATVFFRTAYRVLLPGIVDEKDLAEGNAKLMGSREVAQIAGPSLGGVIAELAGPAVGLLADSISFAISFACLSTLRGPRDRRSARRDNGGTLHGLRFIARDPYIRAMTAFAALANLTLTGADALIVVFLVRTIGVSSGVAGLVLAGFGVGGVLGALIARPAGRRFGTARALLLNSVVGLSCTLLLPLAGTGPRLALAFLAFVPASCGVVAGNVIVASFEQTYVPADMLGRVSSASMTISYAMMPAGALLAGTLATALGVRDALWILTGLLSTSGLLYLLTPIRHLRDLPERPAVAPELVSRHLDV
jgi:predicted MFS family arabinose efflux permease